MENKEEFINSVEAILCKTVDWIKRKVDIPNIVNEFDIIYKFSSCRDVKIINYKSENIQISLTNFTKNANRITIIFKQSTYIYVLETIEYNRIYKQLSELRDLYEKHTNNQLLNFIK